jgi:hypothetical protein
VNSTISTTGTTTATRTNAGPAPSEITGTGCQAARTGLDV